jgi:hypothetical protein
MRSLLPELTSPRTSVAVTGVSASMSQDMGARRSSAIYLRVGRQDIFSGMRLAGGGQSCLEVAGTVMRSDRKVVEESHGATSVDRRLTFDFRASDADIVSRG